MIDSLFSRRTRIVFWHVILNVPSMPETCAAGQNGAIEGEGTNLHRRDQHSRETEGHLLGMFLRS